MDRSPKKMIRVGLVGTGHIAPYHLQAIRRIEDIIVIGVYDSDANRLRSFVAQHNLGVAFESYDRLLEQVDVVHILTPPESHADLALRAIEAGCHVFVEKPLAVTADACDEIAEAARRAGRIVGVDHSLLCDPFTRRALELVQQGKIGRVVSVHCTRSQDYPEYEGGPLPPHTRDAAFPFADLGIHSLYQIELFLGPVENMQWTMRHQGSDYQLAFDEWHALVECRDGNAQLYLSWNARPLQDVLMVLGTKGVLRLDRFGMHVTTKLQGRLPEHPRRAWNAVWEAVQIGAQVPMNLARFMTGRLRRYHGLQDMVHEFYESVRTNRPARVGPEDARRVVSWVERISADARRRWNIQRADCESAGNAKTLVTGATGFIGGHLLQRLLNEARPVRILCRHLPPQAIRSNPLVEAVIGDLGDPEVVDRAMRGIQCVYHLGGTVHGTSQQFWRGNVRGTENVITSALRHQVSQVIYVSSLSVLQAANVGDTVLREDAVLECHPERRGLYTQTKLVAEKKVLKAAQDQGLPVVVVRPGEVIGPGAQLLSSGVAHRMANRLIIMGDGHLRLPLIHVGDLVDALRACEAKQIVDGTVVHLVDPNAATQNEMADAWQKLMGRSTPVFHVPKGLLFPLGWCSEWVFRMVGKNSPMSIYRLKSALKNRRFDTSRASQLLEWTPQRGIWRGLQDTIESNRAGTDCDSTPSEPDGILAHHVISNN